MFYRRDATRVSLAYRYHNPNWDLARNHAVYGDDHNVEGIGANMTIWLEVAGELDAATQLLIPENSLQPALSRLKSLLDHRCLFEVEPWFRNRVPTLENIVIFLSERIDRPWHSLTVQENENWRVQILNGQPELLVTYMWMDGFTKMEATAQAVLDEETGLARSRENMRLFRVEKAGKNATECRFV
jgi:6-pyruvoyl-tetrahydropterin synthase